jgi:bifunctional pyridoxal-dependent enzyme with beta-cystathionase and maltose regulon repressor activities
MFENSNIDFDVLKQRAFNLRWASVAEDIIPLTAADPDFKCAIEITEAICRFSKDRYFCYGQAEGMPAFKESASRFFLIKEIFPFHQQIFYLLIVQLLAFIMFVKLFCKQEMRLSFSTLLIFYFDLVLKKWVL